MEIISRAESLFRQGCASLDADSRRAIALFEKALSINPKHQGALVKLALCLTDKEKRQSLLLWANTVDPTTDYGKQAAYLLKEMQPKPEEKPLKAETLLKATIQPPQGDHKGNNELSIHRSLEPGMIIGGKYEILELLSAGGQGTTYKAIDNMLKQICVVKQLIARRGKEKDLPREANMLVKLNEPGHEGIPEIYAYIDEFQCLVIKYIDGENLYNARSELGGLNTRKGFPLVRFFTELFNRKRHLSESYALKYMRDISSALAYMHNHKGEFGEFSPKIHGDVTPGNLIINEEGRIWLIDFGLTQTSDTLGNRAGTEQFIAPEQDKGQAEPRSDVYSLGKTFEYLLKLHGEQPTVSKALSRLLKHMTQDQVSDRPTAEWLRDTIDQLLSLRRAQQVIAGLISVLLFALLLNLALFMPRFGLAQGINNGRQEFATIQARNSAENTSFDRLRSTMAAERSTIQAQMTAENASLKRLQETIVAEKSTVESLRNTRDARSVVIQASPITSYDTTTGFGSQRGELTGGRYSQFWTFQATAGKSLLIKVVEGSSGDLADPVLYLFDPNGNVVESNDDINGDILDNFSACIELKNAQNGLYAIQVASYMYHDGRNSGLGSYQLTIQPAFIQANRQGMSPCSP